MHRFWCLARALEQVESDAAEYFHRVIDGETVVVYHS
jgi:hypothetical protein